MLGLPKNRYRWRVVMARIRQAKEIWTAPSTCSTRPSAVYAGDFSPNVRPVPALRARVWVALGRIDEALGWAREQGLSAEDDLSYLREFEHITLAKVLLARYAADRSKLDIAEATRLLARLLRAAEEGQAGGECRRDPGGAGARAPGTGDIRPHWPHCNAR